MKKWTYFVSLIAFICFIVLALSYEQPILVQFDETMNQLFFGNSFISFFHLFGETKFIMIISIILILSLWFRQRNYRGMLLVLLTVGAGNGINQLVKSLIERPRPDMLEQLSSFSFPSGHAMMGLLYVFTIAYIISELFMSQKTSITVWSIAVILVILMGLSRIASSHHYATDVLAGWSLGFTWFIICIYWYESRKRKINKLKIKESA
ncbi:MAG TPA: phosphatase PAP2 family protein [Ureibacillus sp.]|nr:phosphatase PAP2 family protein [Ureibacillus sp.]